MNRFLRFTVLFLFITYCALATHPVAGHQINCVVDVHAGPLGPLRSDELNGAAPERVSS